MSHFSELIYCTVQNSFAFAEKRYKISFSVSSTLEEAMMWRLGPGVEGYLDAGILL